MHCEPLGSVDEMLAPEALTALLETSIGEVHQVSFKTVDALSGGDFLAIQTNKGAGPRLVLKRFSYDSDWIMRASTLAMSGSSSTTSTRKSWGFIRTRSVPWRDSPRIR